MIAKKMAILMRNVVLVMPLAIAGLMAALAPQAAIALDWHVYEGESIQEAIDNAASLGGTVYVHEGTFFELITLRNNVVIEGSGTTINGDIDGDGLGDGSVVSAHEVDSTAMLLNITITNGTGTLIGSVLHGGGMYNSNSSPAVANCTFSSNSANSGGGMYNSNSSPTVTNCTFFSNSAGSFGGGMDNENSSPMVTNCTFSSNSAGIGGAMQNYRSSATVTNCTFSGNSVSSYGGGMEIWNSSPTLTNCTFSGNSGYPGSAIFNLGDSSPTLTNCILWGDTVPEIYVYNPPNTPLVTYCNVQMSTPASVYPGTGNINADPLLTSDCHLLCGSPCVDRGSNSAPLLPHTDFEGDPRIIDGDGDGVAVTDIGADEVDTDTMPPPVPIPVYPADGKVTKDNTPWLDWTDVTDPSVVHYELQVDDNADFSSPEIDKSTGNWSSNTLSELADGLYSWRVRAVDEVGNMSDWTAAWSFTVDTTAPSVPTQVYPTSGKITKDNTPWLDWSDVSDATGVRYQLQVDDNADFSSPVFSKTGMTASSRTLSTLADGTYYWRVRAVDGAGNASAWTSAWSFTIDTVTPSVPVLLYPSDGRVTTDITPWLDWSDATDATGVKYQLQVDNNPDFSSPVVNKSGLTVSSRTLSTLSAGTYHWRVRVVDGAGNASAWTGARSFTIM